MQRAVRSGAMSLEKEIRLPGCALEMAGTIANKGQVRQENL
jgi:hypothetical protein